MLSGRLPRTQGPDFRSRGWYHVHMSAGIEIPRTGRKGMRRTKMRGKRLRPYFRKRPGGGLGRGNLRFRRQPAWGPRIESWAKSELISS